MDQVDSHRLGERVDGHYLVVNLAIVNVSIGEIDLIGVHTESHDGSVVNHACGIRDLDKGTVVCIADSTRLCRNRRKFRSEWPWNDIANRREFDNALF